MLPSLGGLSLHGPSAPTGPLACDRKRKWDVQEYAVHWREVARELPDLIRSAIEHKMDFHPHDPGNKILDAFLAVLRGTWGNTPPETQLRRTIRFLGTYARPFGIHFRDKLRADGTLMEQLRCMVEQTLVPGLRTFIQDNPLRPQYYIRPWHRVDFYKKLHALHPGAAAALNADLDRLMKPLLKGDDSAWFGANATPKDAALEFFKAWLPDRDRNRPWPKFTHPNLPWSPEQMVVDFSLWAREVQLRLHEAARERAGAAGGAGSSAPA